MRTIRRALFWARHLHLSFWEVYYLLKKYEDPSLKEWVEYRARMLVEE